MDQTEVMEKNYYSDHVLQNALEVHRQESFVVRNYRNRIAHRIALPVPDTYLHLNLEYSPEGCLSHPGRYFVSPKRCQLIPLPVLLLSQAPKSF